MSLSSPEMNCNRDSILVAFLLVGFVCSSLARLSQLIPTNDMIEQCRRNYESENIKCNSVAASHNGGCSFECTCNNRHRRTIPLRNFTKCGWEQVCFKNECREVVHGEYDPRIYIALRDANNTCVVDLIHRRRQREVNKISQDGEECNHPITGRAGVCQDDECVSDWVDGDDDDDGQGTRPLSRNDMIEQCRRLYRGENRKCGTIQANYYGGCTFECRCDGWHRRTIPFNNFTDCEPGKVCFNSECREIVHGDYNYRRYIALRDTTNPCLVNLIDRRREQRVRDISQDGEECTSPGTNVRGTCRRDRCVSNRDGGPRTQPISQNDMIAQCRRRYENENRYCKTINANYHGGCTFECLCDGSHKTTIQLKNFTDCAKGKVCFNGQCREVVHGDYDYRKYIALRDVRNPCLVALIDRRLQRPVRNLPQDGEYCVNPDTQLPGRCEGNRCVEDWDDGSDDDDDDDDDDYEECECYED